MRSLCLFGCFTIYLSFLMAPLAAQDLRGTVRGDDGTRLDVLDGAHVFWIGTRQGTLTDSDGIFRLHGEGVSDRRLVVSHVAFAADTIDVNGMETIDVVLSRTRSADLVEVEASSPATFITPLEQKTEVITAEELEHAACCDLSGCFGTTSSVEADAVDIITDTRQLKMLGLDGVYTQVLLENTPALAGGLNTHLGVSFIPGPFIDRIYVSKGATSVVQGSESFTGLINVMLRECDGEEPFFFNAFTNSFLEQQYNAYLMGSDGPWSAMLALHGVRRGRKQDRNGDGFLDAPLTDRFSVLGKWRYDGSESGVDVRTGVKYTWENRIGGQEAYDANRHAGGATIYGQTMENRRFEGFNKTEIDLGQEQTLSMHLAGSLHRQNALYGATLYEADQHIAYGDAAWSGEWLEEQRLTAGISFLADLLDETIDLGSNPHSKTYAGIYRQEVIIPGIFVENKSWFLDDDLSVVGGVRADFRSDEGTVVTPRLFMRYSLDAQTTLRASAGTAFRVAQVFVQQPAALASWRDIRIAANLGGERAVNYGVSLLRYYDLGPLTGSVNIDAYRTEFSQQVIAEYDDDPRAIVFRNLDGTSAANNLMAEITGEISPFLLRMSYTYSDVYDSRDGRHRTLPFVTRDRILGVVTATSSDDAWQGTMTAEWRGAQRLPQTTSYPEEFRLPETGESYLLLHAHFQRRWDAIDVYAGVENLLDFRQDDPILNAANPFKPWFEPGFAWGPVKGRELYAGIRIRVDVF